MKIVVIGATGTIGRAVAGLLEARHTVVPVGSSRGDLRVDLGSKASIQELFDRVGSCDALVCAAGAGTFGKLDELSDDDFMLGLTNKLMGQINLIRIGCPNVRDGGSFTLTTGMLARHPMVGSAAISTANAGLEGFVRAAALEMPRGIRVNAVSPTFVKETMQAMGMDSSSGMPASEVAWAYRESVESDRSGEVLDVRDFTPQP